jgi:hypothetical protein
MSAQQQTFGGIDADKQQRVQTALDEPMAIEPLADGKFLVKGKYEVDPDVPSCECADYEYRSIACKHIVRVTLELMWNSIERYDAQGRPPKPDIITPNYDKIPRLLKSMDHWVAWDQRIHENNDGTKRWTKVPVDVSTGSFGSSTDSSTWTDFETASAYVSDSTTDAVGLGFVASENDAIVGIDFDDCRDPNTGEIAPIVSEFVSSVDTYVEVSPSGTGVRAFVLGQFDNASNQAELPGAAHVEMYQWGRYLTVTGQRLTTHGVNWDDFALQLVESLLDGDEN